MKIPKRPETIKRHIIQYEKFLKSEKRKFGCYDDSGGIRYVIGSYYMLAGDIEGALKHFKWFTKMFPDDCGEPGQYLSWTLSLYKLGDTDSAYIKFLQTLFMNPFVIAKLIGIDYVLPYTPGSNIPTQEWAEWVPVEIYNLWDGDAIIWLKKSFESEKTQELLNRFNDLEKQLETEHAIDRRRKLINKIFALRKIRSVHDTQNT